METLAKKDAALVNDLIEINNDRIAGYNKAIALLDKTQDSDIISLFQEIGQQSQQFKTELSAFADLREDAAHKGKSVMGKLYHMWVESKIAISGSDRKTILSSCEKGENAFKRLYTDVLHEALHMNDNIRSIIKSQAEQQTNMHDRIKDLHDKS